LSSTSAKKCGHGFSEVGFYLRKANQESATRMIEISKIHKTYHQGGNEIRALDGIDLSIAKGEFVAIMGPSGSGKSTLLNVLGALDKPDSGTYHLDDDEIGSMDDDASSDLRNRRIGFVFQSFHLLPRLTVLENVLLPQRYAASIDLSAETRAKALLERIGLGQRMDHLPGELSGGQLQRAAIARALLNQPALLLADEPTGNLDSKSAVDVLELLAELNAAGQTLVLVTHDPNIAAKAGRTIHLRDGKVAEVGV
jgi:putative ABC transport system ATP-binding protein